ncbi:MAG: VWA domain-containing protein, partial [Anaerolineae bacterium]|nr:VWA domain-containing protein [Anaerolineae bacterium]
MSEEVTLVVQTNRPAFPATGSTQLAYVLVEARPTGAVARVRMPLNFAFVLDHSGSMSGAKLANLKAAAKMAVDRLSPGDLVSIVIFDDKVQVLVPSRPADNPTALKREIDGIRDGGGTEMSRGMRAGLDELRKGLSPGRVNRMLLLTDGETFGDEDVCRKLATEAGRNGIPIIALGLGEDWNEKLLDDIAEASKGVSDFIPDQEPEAILKSFEEHVCT